MTSVRKKTSSEIFRTPRWLRGPPTSLRSIINREEVLITAACVKRSFRSSVLRLQSSGSWSMNS